MLEILDSPDHILAFKVSGTLDGDAYDRLIAAVEAKLAQHRRIGLYADATGFSDMTSEAVMKDLRYNLTKLGEWSRFPRAALITDKQWLKGLVAMLDPLFPQFDARSFAPGEEAQAMAWAAGGPRS